MIDRMEGPDWVAGEGHGISPRVPARISEQGRDTIPHFGTESDDGGINSIEEYCSITSTPALSPMI